MVKLSFFRRSYLFLPLVFLHLLLGFSGFLGLPSVLLVSLDKVFFFSLDASVRSISVLSRKFVERC